MDVFVRKVYFSDMNKVKIRAVMLDLKIRTFVVGLILVCTLKGK